MQYATWLLKRKSPNIVKTILNIEIDYLNIFSIFFSALLDPVFYIFHFFVLGSHMHHSLNVKLHLFFVSPTLHVGLWGMFKPSNVSIKNWISTKNLLLSLIISYCCVQEMCSALNSSTQKKKLDESIQNGFRWLLQMIGRMWDELDERVKEDVKHKQQHEKREKAERAKRVQRSRELRCFRNYKSVCTGFKVWCSLLYNLCKIYCLANFCQECDLP